MFWGLIMEPGKCYTQNVKVSFHISMASLDISTSGDESVQVMCIFEGRNYLLCTLNKKDKVVQCPLDLNFEAGTTVAFGTNGSAHVHLTGYLTNFDDEEDDDDFTMEEIEEKLKTQEKKRPKKKTEGAQPLKKQKLEEEGEEEESDSDFDIDELMGEGTEEASDEDGEEEEESGEEEESEEEVEVKPKKKPQQNGVAKNQNQKLKKETQEKVKETSKKKEAPKESPQKLKKSILKGGVIAQDLKEGTGDIVKDGKLVHVYYEGRLKTNNKMFDSTTKGPGFSFRVGKGEVIKGWDIGLVGMKAGGKRRIVCPPKVAYGSDGSPPVIPPNATLVFDVEVKKVG